MSNVYVNLFLFFFHTINIIYSLISQIAAVNDDWQCLRNILIEDENLGLFLDTEYSKPISTVTLVDGNKITDVLKKYLTA